MRYYYGNNFDNTAYANIADSWSMRGYGGDDTLGGYNYNDYIYGGTGNDLLRGYNGNDRLYGGDDNDYLSGGAGTDYLWGEAGNDRLYGGSENDQLVGGSGLDRLYGGTGNDKLFGEGDSDYLYGESGNDQLVGGDGNDVLNGGFNTDSLWGSAGSDKFVYSDNGGTDRIKDFDDGFDRIVVDVAGYDEYADVAVKKSGWDNDGDGLIESTIIKFGGSQYLIVQDTLTGQLSGADFQFI